MDPRVKKKINEPLGKGLVEIDDRLAEIERDVEVIKNRTQVILEMLSFVTGTHEECDMDGYYTSFTEIKEAADRLLGDTEDPDGPSED